MISFSDYVKMNLNKALNTSNVEIHKEMNTEKNEIDVIKSINPKIWTAKTINEENFLFYNEHSLNITKLKQAIDNLYQSNGYSNYGFSKLSESDLVRYKTIKNIILHYFLDENSNEELDFNELAEAIFDSENKDFEWKPEPLTI